MVAGQGGLVEHGHVGAGKAPLGVRLDVALVVLDGQADVEDLASVVHVGVVSVSLALAGEGVHVGVSQDILGAAGQTDLLAVDKGDAGHQQAGQEGGGQGGGRGGGRGLHGDEEGLNCN